MLPSNAAMEIPYLATPEEKQRIHKLPSAASQL
jgi:hypothetical protein